MVKYFSAPAQGGGGQDPQPIASWTGQTPYVKESEIPSARFRCGYCRRDYCSNIGLISHRGRCPSCSVTDHKVHYPWSTPNDGGLLCRVFPTEEVALAISLSLGELSVYVVVQSERMVILLSVSPSKEMGNRTRQRKNDFGGNYALDVRIWLSVARPSELREQTGTNRG